MANEYLKKVNRTFEDPILIDLKIQAKKDLVPIVSDEGIRLILHLIEIGKYQRVLEIGTAIGYTTYSIAKHTNASIVT
ncbi:MAG: hypothetical protein Q7J06_04245, partial [Bacteroidales bacterium]|nr:hypothetical protein [Bacteroidales bacterium]